MFYVEFLSADGWKPAAPPARWWLSKQLRSSSTWQKH